MTSTYPGLAYNLSRGTWSPAPASASSREAAEACELRRDELPAYVLDIEADVRQAARQLGIGPPRIRYLPAATPLIRGVVFTPHYHELWAKLQPKNELRQTCLHELRHLWQLQNGGANYKSAGLFSMEARQQDADDFAASWRWQPTRYKAIGAVLTKAASSGTFEGLAATWDTDQANERFVYGAFAESLKKRSHRPLLWAHDHTQVVGVELSLVEDRTGLRGSWRFSDTQLGRDTGELVKSGAVTSMSIGFFSQQTRPARDGATEITKADVLECSLVSLPCNVAATVQSVKGMPAGTDVVRELARRRRIFMGRRVGTGVRPR